MNPVVEIPATPPVATPSQEKLVLTLAELQATTGKQEIGGPTGPEPTRYGDWEKKGRCIDF